MESKHVKRLPVVTDGRLVGVVSRADLLRALQTALSDAPLAGSTDETLQKKLTAELAKQPWAGRGGVTVTVTDRIVHLAGIIYDVRERDALRVAAENMPGVAGVHDQLYYVSPEAGFAYPLG
jgi:predicted transcriptional regulator